MLKVKRLEAAAKLPTKAYKSAAGYDIYALETVEVFPTTYLYNDTAEVYLEENSVEGVRTGIAVEIPEGYYGRLAEKSGLALQNISIGGGVIDSDFRGEILVIMRNLGVSRRVFEKGTKIAQLILEKIGDFEVFEVPELTQTCRDSKGFGSSGKF